MLHLEKCIKALESRLYCTLSKYPKSFLKRSVYDKKAINLIKTKIYRQKFGYYKEEIAK